MSKIVYRSFFLFLIVGVLSVWTFGSERENNRGGILTNDEGKLVKLTSDLTVSKKWSHVTNDKSTTCKFYAHKIHFSELEKQLDFSDDDLVEVTDANSDKYGDSSVYWRSCNRLWYFGKEDVPNHLARFEPDYVVDGPKAVLLIKSINQEEELVRAVVVSKVDQIISNKKEEETIWGSIKNMIHTFIWGHPEVKQYELENDTN